MVTTLPVPAFALPAADFEKIFPFFLVVDRAGRIVAAGRSLRKLSPAVQPGAELAAVFTPKRPAEPLVFATLAAATGRLYTIREKASGATLRGQFQRLGDDLVFVGSPWVTDPAELLKFGLSINDFAAHDPTLELQQMVEIQRVVSADLQKLTAKLTAQRAELEAAARTKDAFLASMSHELRTPLTSVIGLSEVLLEQGSGPLNETQLRQIGVVHASGTQLLALINDILDLTRLGSGEQQLLVEDCSVSELCTLALRKVEIATAKRNQRVSFENSTGARTLRTDQRRTVQVLEQLLGNASKFTPVEGELGLRVTASDAAVVFTVWDRGIGIAEADLPNLFRPFVQIDGRLARRYGGTGLGLAIVDKIVALLGGTVAVTSTRGAGSAFTVTLPSEGSVRRA